jgi:predicted Zn-dependent peptidase
MKKLQTFTDTLTKITHTIYELDNGIKIFHAKNPSSIEYVLSVIIRAGSSFENINKVPHGTAHFLEHILSGNPNKIFKTKFEMDKFRSGTKKEPRINYNAITHHKYIHFFSFGNEKASKKVNIWMKSMLDYPTENISKYIEKERKIILAEQSRKNKEEFDNYLQFIKFLYNHQENNFTYRILGEKEDIKKIGTKDLKNFLKNQFFTQKGIITVQTGRDLKQSEIKEIEEIGNLFKPQKTNKNVNPEFVKEKRVQHFTNNQMEGVYLDLIFFQPYRKKINYKEEVLKRLFRSLINKVSHDYLREELGLIYSSKIFTDFYLNFREMVIGYEMSIEPKNFNKTLTALNNVIDKKLKEFLNSKEGKIWFESLISSYIFPQNLPYQTNYAELKALPLIEDCEVFEMDKAVEKALTINIEDVLEYSNKFFSQTPIFWIESDRKDDKYIKILKQSKLYNRF